MVGMAVMGSNMALNMADHGFDVACYNYTPELTEKVMREHPHEHMHGFYDLKEFVDSLKRPRKIMFLIMAGKPVDSMIAQLEDLLEPGDIILDGGNSFFEDTRRRYAHLKRRERPLLQRQHLRRREGRHCGPCIMPGGDADAYEEVRPIYEAVAAKADGRPCCTYIGEDGAGHYVKMVHNGIEYADMQLIAESYLLLKYVGGLSNEELSEAFHDWNQGELKSFLIGITADIFAEDDDLGEGQLVDKIEDSAGQKGTGRWTSIQAMKQGVNTSLITAACNARVMSNLQTERAAMRAAIPAAADDHVMDETLLEDVRRSLYAGKIAAYAQGFSLYRSAADVWMEANRQDYRHLPRWLHHSRPISSTRSPEAYEEDPSLANLMMAPLLHQEDSGESAEPAQSSRTWPSPSIPIPALPCGPSISCAANPAARREPHPGAARLFSATYGHRTDREGTFPS